MSSKNVYLITIDGQNDFCDPKGSLFVKGADEDMKRLATFIKRNGKKISQIVATLDSHQVLHVAHPLFWQDKKGNAPAPFTLITAAEVVAGEWSTRHPGWRNRAVSYVTQLEANSRYPLLIWPVHCRIGSWGHAIVPELDAAFKEWEEGFNRIQYVAKGSNLFTEHYSAVQADVPDDTDPSTSLNTTLLDTLADSEVDTILITGEALSHCVKFTIEDVANNFGEDNIKKFVLLEDTLSSVTGFEQQGEDFVKSMVARGMKTMKSTDWF